MNFERAKHLLEENDGAGNTFKATAKPVLIGTAVVGATTMIFSIIVVLTHRPDSQSCCRTCRSCIRRSCSASSPAAAMIYWFTGASTQAVTTGAYRAVEFIKANIKLDGVARRRRSPTARRSSRSARSTRRRGCSTSSSRCSSRTLGFAFLEPYFFIGYLISIALFGLFQAIFMANAGGAWDNAKKIVEVELKEKGTPLHAATVVGDTVGDPFKDTSSVALNPVIKFTTLFGLLAVELGVQLAEQYGAMMSHVLAGAFILGSAVFVWRSFYGMRIRSRGPGRP